MALQTVVKINRVNNLSDARYCAGMGVNIMGFNITPDDEEFISPDLYNGMSEWISGVEMAGEVYGSSMPDLEQYPNLEYLQIDSLDMLPNAIGTGLKVIYRIDLDEVPDSDVNPLMERIQLDVDYFLLESHVADLDGILYQTIKGLSEKYPIVLGFGFNKDSISTFLERLPVKGIAMNGGNEIRPGYKDFDELADILEVLEIED